METNEPAAIANAPGIVLPASNPERRHGYLIFNGSRSLVHTSSSLISLLRLPGTSASIGKDVCQLLSAAVGPDPDSLLSLQQWLGPSAPRSSTEAPKSLGLLTAKDARTLHASLTSIGDQYWVADFEDVTLEMSAENDFRAIAYQDRLTGIGNRSFFENTLDDILARLASKTIPSVTVLFLDLDRFKVVNDTLGHAVGDALLKLVAGRLQGSLRPDDTLARLGGDEFAIVLALSSEIAFSSNLAARIIDLIQRPYLVDGHAINIGASIGIAVAPDDGESRDQLLKAADLALYHSKASGRGVYHFFQPAMEEKAQRRRTLEMDLRKALLLRQFVLHYQSQIDVETGKKIGLKGLLRWRHPKRGLLLPPEFLSLAEELGLIVAIGDWVLKTSCLEALRWPESVTIAVNVSSAQFEMKTFAASVGRLLREVGLTPARLEIEVTEDILMRNESTVQATLIALRSMGVRVVMDSFGTGLASLSQLVSFPFDRIKIDRLLLSEDTDDGRNRAIVRAISVLGEALGISTQAEGVKTSEQLAHVRLDGCDSLQGFYYSEAVPASELTDLASTLLASDLSADHSKKEDL